MNEVARAEADGHTIGFSSVSPLVLSPAIREVPYDPQKDIAPIGSVMVSPVILLGTKAFTGKSMADLMSQSQAEPGILRSEEHTSELQSLMRISYAVFCLKKKK